MSHHTLAELEPASPFLPRRTDRAIVQLRHQTQVGLARIGQTAALQAMRVETVACVSRRAMFETALLTQCEQQLAQLVPLSAARLQAIGDIATLGLAEVVSDTVRSVSR